MIRLIFENDVSGYCLEDRVEEASVGGNEVVRG